MDNENARQRVFSRRLALIAGLKIAGLGALGGRLYYLQVTESDKYATLAEDNRINMRLLAPVRGLIVDRAGVSLAANEQNFRAVVVPERAGDIETALKRFAQFVPLTETDLRRIVREIGRRPSFMAATVRENLSWEEVSLVELNAPDLPGFSIDEGQIRTYPFAAVMSHVIGYVGRVSESELNGDPVLSLPGFRIGKGGIERQHEAALRGAGGRQRLEVNALGRVIRELDGDVGQQGREIQLTIDIGLQGYAMQRLAQERSAAAVVIDTVSGEIYAMASSPSFDPNLFTRGISAEIWEELLSDPAAPLTNKTITGQYAPGSTFKMMTLLAGLDSGAIDANFRAFCPGHLDLGSHRFHCWRRGGHGTVGIVDSLKHSCDVFYYELSKRVGIDRIAAMARIFGLGGRLGLDLPSERPGLIPDRQWKRANYNKAWLPGETLNASIGQGYVLATPLQLAVMAARIASGYAVQPHLTRQIEGQPPARDKFAPLPLHAEHLALARKGMEAVMGVGGTAYQARITEAGMAMAGKTGTAQVRRITMAERNSGVRKNEDLPWNRRDHALFVAYAPVGNPRYACAVVVEHGGGGSTVAGPIARDIMIDCQRRDPANTTVA
jgi:penicillin-binding protein 2